MIADENYVHLRRGGMLHFVGPTGMDCYAVLECKASWPAALCLSHSPAVDLFNHKCMTWIDATGLADWLRRTRPFHQLNRGQSWPPSRLLN